MKTFEQLTNAEKAKAIGICTNDILRAICEGAIRFDDLKNDCDLQARIDAAWEKAEAMRTPWFIHEFIMDTCRKDIEGMARCDAEDAMYASPDERVIEGVVS